MTFAQVELLERLPTWAVVVVAIGLLLLIPAAERIHRALRADVTDDRKWWTEVEKDFTARIELAVSVERERSKDALAAEAKRCDDRVDLVEKAWVTQVGALKTEVSVLKDQQVRLLSELSAAAVWEPRAWGLRELAIGAGVPKPEVDEVWLVTADRRQP